MDTEHVIGSVKIHEDNLHLLKTFRGPFTYVGDPNYKDKDGKSPLHYAAWNKFVDSASVKTLMKIGANVDILSDISKTPLHIATFYANKIIIKMLLKHGANVNIGDYNGDTPLHTAATYFRSSPESRNYEDHLLIVKMLLKNRANVNKLNYKHETPLIQAVKGSHFGIVRELLHSGAKVRICDEQFRTCLHIVSSDIHKRAVLMELVKKEAHLDSYDSLGKTALDIILQLTRQESMSMLKALTKAAVLVGKEDYIDSRLDENNYRLYKFIERCFDEVHRMKSIRCSNAFSLFDFVLHGARDPSPYVGSEETVCDAVLARLKEHSFHLYNDLIEVNFERSYLIQKLHRMNDQGLLFSGMNIKLNNIVLSELFYYLVDQDLFNLIKIYF